MARIRLSLHSRSGRREVQDDKKTSPTCGQSPKRRFLDFASQTAEAQQRQIAKWECKGQMRRSQTQRNRRPSRPPAAMCRSVGTAPHGLFVLLLPSAFAAPYLTPQGAHHHHPNHGNPELHAKPNGIQCVHRPPLATGCTPLPSEMPNLPLNTSIMTARLKKRDGT